MKSSKEIYKMEGRIQQLEKDSKRIIKDAWILGIIIFKLIIIFEFCYGDDKK